MAYNPNVSTGTIGAASPTAGTQPANHKYYVKEFLEVANPELVYDMFGTNVPIPSNSSNTISFNKIAKMAVSVGDRTQSEGVTDDGQKFTLTRLEKAVNQYGGFAITSDRLQEESVNGLTSQFTTRIGEQAGETLNLVVRDDLLGGTNVRRTAGVATIDAIDNITTTAEAMASLNYIFAEFKGEKVKPIRPMTSGSPNTNTTPTRETYPVVVPVEAISLIEDLDDGNGNAFVSTERYASQRPTWTNEYGTFKQFSFILDTECSIATNAAGTPQSIARSLVFGKGAFHTTSIGSESAEIIIKPLGSAGTEDALNQRASIGWKARKAAVIVQPNWMCRWEYSLGPA